MLWLPTPCPSQCSLHRAPIFRLLLKVAFAKMSAPNFESIASTWSLRETILKKCSARCPCVCVAWKHTISWCCSNIVQDCCSACGRATKSIRRCFGHHFLTGWTLSLCVRFAFSTEVSSTGLSQFLVAMHCKAQTVTSKLWLNWLHLDAAHYSTIMKVHESGWLYSNLLR